MRHANPLISIDFRNRRVKVNGRPIHLTKRFLVVYCYLAAVRISDPRGNGGYADPDEIRALPGWHRNSPLSVGKQISRHVWQMSKARRNVIGSESKTAGPFRLSLPPSRIKLDVPPSEIFRQYSLREPIKGKRGPDESPKVAREFTEKYWQGVSSFNDGKLPLALRHFRSAMNEAPDAQHWLAASFHIQRILERRGDFEESRKLRAEESKRLKNVGAHWNWAELNFKALDAWNKYREGNLDAAENGWRELLAKTQNHGHLDILGRVHNGLAEIAKKRQQYPEALSHYLAALDAWLLVDYFYGFQAVYFNIAVLLRNWGDILSKQGDTIAAKQKYESALEWAEACLRLCQGMAIGDDTSENEILLSNIYRHLGRLQKAEQFALDAKKSAESSGNQRSIALSARVLAKVLVAKGEKEKAIQIVRECYASAKPAFRKLLGPDALKLLANA